MKGLQVLPSDRLGMWHDMLVFGTCNFFLEPGPAFAMQVCQDVPHADGIAKGTPVSLVPKAKASSSLYFIFNFVWFSEACCQLAFYLGVNHL